MTRYSLAASLTLGILSTHETTILAVQGHELTENENEDPWYNLLVKLPTPISDTSVVSLKTDEGKTRIILTGGCDNPDGNVVVGPDFYECPSLTNKAYAFDPIRHSDFQAWTGDFETLADMPRERARHASAIVNGHLCVYGGRNVTDHLIAEVDCYDPASNEWTVLPTTIPTEHLTSDLTAFVPEDNKVYLVGGYDQGYTAFDAVTIVDMSDLDAISFTPGPTLDTKRGDIDYAAVDGDFYVSGGFTHENDWEAPLNTVEKFSLATGKWSAVDALNEERGDKQLVAVNGKVYAIGGEDKVDTSGVSAEELELAGYSLVLDTVEVLDPAEDVHAGLAQWKSLAKMPSGLFRFSASEWEVEGEDGVIFVFGGQKPYNSDCKCFATTDTVMVFDIHRAVEHLEKDPESLNSAGEMVLGGTAMAYAMSIVMSLIYFG